MDIKELLSSKNPNKLLLEEGGSFYKLIDKLHQYNSLPDELMIPIIEVGQICGFNFYHITQLLLKVLVENLEKCIDSSPDIIPDVLNSLHPFLNCTDFYPLFDKIVLRMPTLPDYFLLELSELPAAQLLNIFPSHQTRSIIFLKCKPIFYRLVFTVINEFVDNPLNLDRFLNSIIISIPKKPGIDDFSREFEYFINIQTEKKGTSTLKELHNEICNNTREKLLDLCCENPELYQEICCILRDLWEKTGNPIYAALRLEISYQDLSWRQDGVLPLSRWILRFLSNYSLTNAEPLPQIKSKDASFVTNDPQFQFLLLCVFLKLLVIRVSRCTYVPFNRRDDCATLLSILYPNLSRDHIEDFANYIEAYYVGIDLFDDPICDESIAIVNMLKEIVNENKCFSNLILFCGQQLVQRSQDQNFINIIADDENYDALKPNIIIANIMLLHLSDVGIVEVNKSEVPSELNTCVDKRLKIIYNWSLINHTIRLYFIAMLEKRSLEIWKMAISMKNEAVTGQKDGNENPFYKAEYQVLEKWTNLMKQQFYDLDEIENSMLDAIKYNLSKVV